MIKNRSGVIITVSSGFPDISTYCASKFGILGLTESLAWEVGNYNRRSMPYIQVRWKKEQLVIDLYSQGKTIKHMLICPGAKDHRNIQ